MSFPHCDVRDLNVLLWTHVGLLSFTAILIVAAFNSQIKDAAPYGRHAEPEKAKAWGFPIPQRVGHIVSDGLPGIPFLVAVYLLYSGLLPTNGRFSEVRPINVVLLSGWLLHYLYRGIVHPLIMPYSSQTVPIGITISGLFPNLLFSYLIAAQLACTIYPDNWASGPRFIIGVVLYVIGTAINRWADLKLRAGRLAMRRRDVRLQGTDGGGFGAAGGPPKSGPSSAVQDSLLGARDGGEEGEGDRSSAGSSGAGGEGGGKQIGPDVQTDATTQGYQTESYVRQHYFLPRGGLFELISSPNYFGELIEWVGYALAVWSWPALGWALFGAATFIPRSLTHQRWYKQHFGEQYPAKRKAIIPFIF